jgi:hypothetical protein
MICVPTSPQQQRGNELKLSKLHFSICISKLMKSRPVILYHLAAMANPRMTNTETLNPLYFYSSFISKVLEIHLHVWPLHILFAEG